MTRGEPALVLHVSLTGEPPARLSAVAARREVRRTLTDHLSAVDLDAVLLATSELVNNALAHNEGRCAVRLWSDPASIRVEVADSGSTLPVLPAVPPPAQLSGRGLNIVDTLVDRWGTEREATGKFVWFELDLHR